MNYYYLMPLSVLKEVWKYCSENEKSLIIIFIVMTAINYSIKHLTDYYTNNPVNMIFFNSILIMTIVIFTGYGTIITRDIINYGTRLPKINIKEIFYLGIPGTIIIYLFFSVQEFIIKLLCVPLHFPEFDLEELLVNLPETLHMLHAHSPLDLVIFIVVGSILYYITSFFMEVAISKFADTKKFLHSFNIYAIFKDIHTVGWYDYAKEFTTILLAMVILSYIQNIHVGNAAIDFIIFYLFDFGVFVTQFMGIGIAYKNIKAKAKEKHAEIN